MPENGHAEMIDQLDILYEDNHLLVLNKPAGIATMGVEAGEASLLNDAKAYLKEKYNKPGKVYLGVVSRIDARVSGCIVFARTSKSAARLSEQFRERTTEKIYWALVEAAPSSHPPAVVAALQPDAEPTTLEDWMYKDEPAMRMRCCSQSMKPQQREKLGAKQATMAFRPLVQ